VPVFRLGSEILFPPPRLAEVNGLLAIGGDLLPQRLLLAYSQGIFPWYNAGEPILWWSPVPRCVLLPGDFHLSRSLRKLMRAGTYRLTIDQSFAAVIRACATSGERRLSGTWISAEMVAAYEELFALGFCHSVEVWAGEELVGGLYGVSLGRCFFGESMFHFRTDASKMALYALSQALFLSNFVMIDMQLPTPHLLSLGGRLLEREPFELLLKDALAPGHSLSRPFPDQVAGL
jgi:leucyl/phenylalanyl-tRNA---protein transferase